MELFFLFFLFLLVFSVSLCLCVSVSLWLVFLTFSAFSPFREGFRLRCETLVLELPLQHATCRDVCRFGICRIEFYENFQAHYGELIRASNAAAPAQSLRSPYRVRPVFFLVSPYRCEIYEQSVSNGT